MQPVIKWSGSKRSQANDITANIQKNYETYYEPFCGSCAVLAYIIENENNLANKFKRFVCSDLNKDLINSYNLIKSNPLLIIESYSKMWNELNKKSNSLEDKKKYFHQVRTRLNNEHLATDFIFIMRTTTNGMPRYNKNGDFNNSFHITRDGIIPDKFEKIVYKWSELLKKYEVEFIHQSFEKIKPTVNDLVYFDPPYANTKGMYFGGFDKDYFFAFLGGLQCDWLLSYDGVAGDNNLIVEVPETLYKRHLLINNGNSSFHRVIGKDKYCNVQESLYVNF